MDNQFHHTQSQSLKTTILVSTRMVYTSKLTWLWVKTLKTLVPRYPNYRCLMDIYIYIHIYSPTNGKLIGFDSSPHLHARSRRGFVAREECRQLRSDDSWRTWDDLQETTVFPMENMGLSSKGSLKQPGFPILGHNFKWGVSENGLPQRFTLAVADCFWMSLANSKEMANSSPSWMMTHVHE